MKQTFSLLSNKVISKLIAVVTSVCFIVTGVFIDCAQAVAIYKQEKKSIENTQTFITLPSIGLITTAIDFGSQDIIINIQDLHSHPQTQRNIAKIISYLDSKYKLDGLFLEGAYGNVDTKWLTRMEENKLGKQIIEDLVDAGQLGGVEYYSAINNKDNVIKGIEDKNIYEENIKLLNEIIDLQPEISAICDRMEKEIGTVKKDYFNRDTDKLDKLVKRYKANKISANKYYEKLSKLAKKSGIDLNKYENVKAYIELLSQSKSFNLEKISREFKNFVNILKSKIEYSRYLELSKTSNNFQDIENIVSDLKDIAEKHKIFETHKFSHLKNFITYLEFNKKVNLIGFVQEEKQLLNQLYARLSQNKYEQEVAFLYEFVPTIKEYFGANITANDYLRFRDDFKKFRIVWNSYFSKNTSKQLYKYEQLLSKYHSNNIKRDEIFADKVLGDQNNNTNFTELYGQSAISKLSNEINDKTIKVIVTGGFHSQGLERIAKERKISYIQITPKITKDISRAGETHWNTIRGYRQVLNNTINAKPLTETWLNILFPEIVTRALIATNEMPEFAQLNTQQQKQLVQEVVDEAIKARNFNDKITVVWEIEEFEKNKAKIKATYTDQSDDKEKKYDEEYIFNGKSVQTVGQNDANATPHKLSESTESVQSILNNLFKNTKSFWYKLYTTVIAPVWEEFVFRFIPFAIAGSLATVLPVSIMAIAITATVSIISFSYAHTIADKLRSRTDKQTEVRDWKNFLIPSAIFTGLYLATFIAVSMLLPGIGSYLIALAISTFGHSIYNRLVLEGKIKNSVASVFGESYSQISKTIKQLKDDILNDKPKTVCFVCSGNTDRSPVSEMLFKSLMRRSGKQNIKVKSAGLYVGNNDWSMPLKSEHKVELEKYNVDDDILNGFQTEKLSQAHLQSDYFIVVGKRHKQELINMGVPEEKIIMFSDLSPDLVSGELPDPVGDRELKIQTIALINQIIENNFSEESLLKEPEEIKIQDIDMILVTELITSLKSVTGYNFKDTASKIIEALSEITADTTAEQKNNIIFEQIVKIIEIVKDPTDFLLRRFIPLATIIENPQTGKPALADFIDALEQEKNSIDERASLYSDAWVNNRYSNLTSSAFKMFELAYPVNHENALEIIKMLQKMGFVDTKELPWGVRDTIKEFEDVRNYFMAISESGVDADMLEGLKKTIEMLNTITLSDLAMNTEKESVILNLSSLFDYINPSTAQIVDNQMQKLLSIVANLLKNSKTEESALIIKALLPVGENLVLKTKILSEKTLRDLFTIADQLYNMKEKESSEIIVSYLLFVAKSSDFEDSTRTNERACEYVAKITNTMYNSIKNLEKNNDEYIKISNKILEMFRYLAENSPDDIRYYRELFDNLGFNTETLSILITALEKSDKSTSPYVPDDQKITNSDEIIDLIIKSRNFIVIERLCLKLYTTGENGKQVVLSLIAKLFKIAEDQNENIELRSKSAVLLGRISALMYKYVNDDNVMSIEKINSLYKELKIDSLLQGSTAYIGNIYGRSRYNDDDSYAEKFDFSPLISRLPKQIVSKNQIRLKSPVFMENSGRINKKNREVAAMAEDFDSLQDILKYNVIVLERIKKLNDRATRRDFDKTVETLVRMIRILKKINPEHGSAAEASLERILRSIPKDDIDANTIKKQISLSKWDTDTILDIEEIHTLINAVHQTSILDFKQKIKDISSMDKGHIRTSKFIRDNIAILAYDLSDGGKMNRDIQSFLTRLASDRVSIDDFVFRDDILVWTTRLFAHSVDIFINFGEKDRGISIYYNENGRRSGYAERVRYFSEVLTRLGFDVVSDTEQDLSGTKPGTCGLKAVLNKDCGLNDETDISEIAAKAVLLYKHSTNLDMELEDLADRYSRDSYLDTLSRLVDKFMAGEIWYGYSYVSNGRTAFREHTMTERFTKPNFSAAKQIFDEIFDYLGIEKTYDTSGRYYELNQDLIDKFFNRPIEQAYEEGRIVLDENGHLVRNLNYDMMEHIIDAIDSDEYDALKQSRIINLVSRSKFNFKTIGFIGNLMFVTGNFKLSNGETLSVRGLMNPYTRRLKYAQNELISATGREKLSKDRLTEVLNGEGYKISSEQELIGAKERERIKSFLRAQIQNTDSPEVLCTGTSDGKGTYVAGNITFDRKNAGPGDILLVKFTTPDDVKTIESVKAVITTGGGTLSHAAITTRELKKPSVVLNGALWKDGNVEVPYYSYEDSYEEVKGYNIRKVKENTFTLKEGARILVNGETGRILLFNDINPETLDELQKYIESKDVENIKSFFYKNKDSKNIKKLVEYVYYQTIGDKELEEIMFVLFDTSLPENVKAKVKELNVVYVKEKVKNISDSIENLKNIDNVNIRYNIIMRLIDKLNYIRTIESRQDLNSLKKNITVAQDEIKDSLIKYMSAIIEEANGLALKKKLNSADIERIVKILHQVSVYKYFVHKSENRQDLIDKRTELENISAVLENRVKKFQQGKKIGIDTEICAFNEISAADGYRFGSKTTELALIYRLLEKIKGVKVPDGIGLSSNVLYMFFSETGQIEAYRRLNADFESAVKAKDTAAAKQTAKKIQQLIEESKSKNKTLLQKIIESKIKNSLRHGARFSVRSSGVGEDSENKAFAGMGETKLNVIYDNVFSNIQSCWASFYSDRCVDYMIEAGQVVKPAVLIQEMVNVDKAGVIFSRNKYGNTVIEGVYGLGEGIVSGIITPDTVEVETTSGEIIEYSVADKYSKIVAAENGTSEEAVSEGAKARVLSAETVKTLMETVNVLEKDAGYPVDIEYGIKDGEIIILQRRPDTAFNNTADTSKTDKTARKIKPQSIADNLLSHIKEKSKGLYKFITVAVVPVVEEAIFRFVPFFTVGLILANPLAIVPVIITSAVSIFAFSYAHTIADKLKFKRDKQTVVRDWKSFLIPSAIFTGLYLITFIAGSIILPGIGSYLIALAVSTVGHSIYNKLAVEGKIQKPVAEILNNKNDKVLSLVASLIKSLQKNKKINNKDAINNIADNLSSITIDTPVEIRNEIICSQITQIRRMLGNLDDILDKYIIPLAVIVKNPVTGKSLIFDFIEEIGMEKNNIDEKRISKDDNGKPVYDDHKLDSWYTALELKAYILFRNIYAVDKDKALELLKMMKRIDFIDNGDIPYLLKDIIKDYDDIEKYFTALADPGIDKDMLDALQKTIEMIRNVKLSGDNSELNAKQELIIVHLESLKGSINSSVAQIALYSIKDLLNFARILIESGYKSEGFEIINALMPLNKMLALKTKDVDDEILQRLLYLFEIIYKSGDKEKAEPIVAYSIFISKIERMLNPKIPDYMSEIAAIMRESIKTTDEKNSEYLNTKTKIIEIYRIIAEQYPNNLKVLNDIFDVLGFNATTLEIFLKAVKHTNNIPVNFSFYRPIEIENSQELADLIVNSSDYIMIDSLCSKLYNGYSGKNNGLVLKVISKLFEIAEDENVNIQQRRKAAIVLGKTASMIYEYMEDDTILSLERINKLYKVLNIDFSISETTAYFEKIYGTHSLVSNLNSDNAKNFDFTPLVKKLPKALFPDNKVGVKPPVYIENDGYLDIINPIVSSMIDNFNSLQELLKYNMIVLEKIKKINSRSTKKDFDKIVAIVASMIEILKTINVKHGNAAEVALNEILKSLSKGDLNYDMMKEQFQLKRWSESEISEIREIHTLINAVHQTSIIDFKSAITDKSIDEKSMRTVKVKRGNTEILAYNLLDNGKINNDIRNFLVAISGGRENIGDFVFKDDILVWTTRLFTHSVDIFINFGEKDRGISIYYNENGRKRGYVERVKYFAEVLKRLGFNVESDTKINSKTGTCGLKAVLNKDFGLNEETTELFELGAKAVLLYKYSDNLDLQLAGEYEKYHSTGLYEELFNRLVDKFIAGEIWYVYDSFSGKKIGEQKITNRYIKYNFMNPAGFQRDKMTARFEKPSYKNVKKLLNGILEYLGLEQMPDILPEEYKYGFEQSVIDKYFNRPIEKAYIEGRIVLDGNGHLARNANYNAVNEILEVVLSDEYDSMNQSRLINLIGISKFNFQTIGFIGSLMVVTGNIKLSDGKTLFVNGLMNPLTKRLEYAQTEIVSGTGFDKLDVEKLTSVLKYEGYQISKDLNPIGVKERERIKSFLRAQIQNTDSPEVLCTGTSDGKGTCVAGNITFDRKNAGPGDILLVKFTTPDDVKTIESVKAVITTGGGTLSHAAITTRELKKPSVVLNGALWKGGNIEVTYYSYEDSVEEVKGLNVIKAKANNVVLKEGTRVLVNGATGRILVFNDVNPQLLDELQKYIDEKNIEGIKSFLNANKNDSNISKIVEYIYFQTIGDKDLEKIMFVLFDDLLPENISQKVRKLNIGYIRVKLQKISEALENLKNIENINIRYGIITKVSEEINYIGIIETGQDLGSLRKDIASARDKIKDSLLKYVSNIIETGNVLAFKKKINESDIENIVKLLHQISVYRYFIPGNEKREDLAKKRNEIKNLVLLLENIVKEYQSNKKISIDSEICSFSEISAGDAYRFGSKTTELAVIYRLLSKTKGVQIPAGIGISANLLYMLFSETGQLNEYKKLNRDFELAVKAKDIVVAKQIAIQIQNLIDKAKDKTRLEEIIKNKIKRTFKNGTRYAVRSSGVGEDSDNKAFAGMGETALNIGYDDIFTSMKYCWKSFYSERCIEYMIKTGQIVKPAVLIQEMINADKAGVIFSRNKYGNTVIEAVYGLGEGMVSGMITPDIVEVETAGGEIIEYSVADKHSKVIAAENGTSEEFVDAGAKERVLSSDMIRRLMKIVNALEKDAGYPVDIEYGIKDDDIYILQRRPITTFEDAVQEQAKEVIAVDEKPIKQMATIVFENISKNQEILFNIANPNVEDEAISVYLKKTDGDIAVFCIDSKYTGKVDMDIILSIIVNRINTDTVVRDKFNSNLSIIARIGEMELGILPFPYIDSDKKIIPMEQDTNIQHIKTMLMSA